MHLIALHDTAGSLLGPKFLYMKFTSSLLKAKLAFILPNYKPPTRIGPHNQKWYTIIATEHKYFSLDGNFVTGFLDAEGSFIVLVLRNKNLKLGWTVKTRFSISLHEKDLAVLELIKSYFGGVVNILKRGKDSVQYTVASLHDLTNNIIPHFINYPLITQKKADFILFQRVVELMNSKEHLTKEGLEKIVSVKGSMNLGLSSYLKGAFPNITLVERPVISNMLIQSSYWLAGFSSGESSFMIKVKKSASHLVGYQVLLEFQLAQHSRDIALMESIINYLDCGVVSEYKQIVIFKVSKLSDINDKIIPFFIKYPIIGVKAKYFSYFCQVASLMNSKAHLTSKGLEEILNIKQIKIIGKYSKDSDLFVETKNILNLGKEEYNLIKSYSIQGGLHRPHARLNKVKVLVNQLLNKRKLSFIAFTRLNSPGVNRFSFQEVNIPSLIFKRTFLVNVKPKSRISQH